MALLTLAKAWLNKNEEFNLKVAGACLEAADDIDNEDPGTTNHANRVIWAAQVRADPRGEAFSMLHDVLSNATIAADVDGATDSDIQFVVNSFIDTYATGG